MKKIVKTVGLVIVGGVLFWLFGLKLILKFMKGEKSAPCPAALSWLVDLPIRKRYMRPVLDRVGIRSGGSPWGG